MMLVSACLAGIKCRYDGKDSFNEKIAEMVKNGEAMAICPEVLGGLKIPRVCCEIKDLNGEKRIIGENGEKRIIGENGEKRIIGENGEDYTESFKTGAEKTLAIAKVLGTKKAILKTKSPSCGYGIVYDGSFKRKLIEGKGITAELLEKNGIELLNENNF